MMDEYFTDDWHEPAVMYARAARAVSDDDFRAQFIVGSTSPTTWSAFARSRELGPTVVCLQNASGADPHGALNIYGAEILPALQATPKAPAFPRSEVWLNPKGEILRIQVAAAGHWLASAPTN